MSIFSLFSQPAAQPTAPAANPAVPATNMGTPGNMPANAMTGVTAVSPATAPNGVVPAGAEAAPVDPLEKFKDFWNTDPNAVPKPDAPLFDVSLDKLTEIARTQDFRSGITREDMEALTAAGIKPEAIPVVLSMMNNIAQTAYAHSAIASTRLIEGGLGKSKFAKAADIENTLKQNLVRDSMAANPAFANPAVQPLVKMVEQQMLVKYPTATPAQLTSMAQEYLTTVGIGASAPSTGGTPNSKSNSAGTDWEKFFG